MFIKAMEARNQLLASTSDLSFVATQTTTRITNLSSDSAAFDSISSDSISVTACRFCLYFDSTGRRGGVCNKLESHVQGDWEKCSLALPIFEASATNQVDIYPDLGDRFTPSFLPKLLPSMSPSMANILVNSSSTSTLAR